MSYITRTKTSAPSAPASGKSTGYVDTTGRPREVNDTGRDMVLIERELPNYVRNSGFWFAQRQAPATLTTYSSVGGRAVAADGWGVSNENASIQFRRVDTSGGLESGLSSRFYGELTKITSTGKIILTQVLEASDVQAVRGRTVTLQAKLKAIIGTPVAIKMAIVSWTGTVDAVTATAGNVFTAFGANGVDPTLGTSLAYIAPKSGVTPDNATAATNAVIASATTTWTRFGGVFDIPTTARNLMIMIWTDNQVVATNGFAISEVSLTDGMEIQDWSPLPLATELARVRRYYYKTFSVDTAPVQNAGTATGALTCLIGKAAATALAGVWQLRYPNELAKVPTITLFNPAAANAQARRVSGAAAADQTATATQNSTAQSVEITATGDAAGTVGDQCQVHLTADAEI